MESDSYNCHGNIWNSSNGGIHSFPDVRSHSLDHRQHLFSQDVNEATVSSHHPYGFLLNHSQKMPCQPSYQHHHVNSTQWQFPQWQSLTFKTSTNLHLSNCIHQLPTAKVSSVGDSIHSDSIRNGIADHITQNLAVSQDQNDTNNTTCDCILEFINKDDRNIQSQNNPLTTNINVNGDVPVDVRNESAATATLVSNPARRKNPAPKKKREEVKTKKDDKRKRVRKEESWARNVRKKARARGESYVSVLGKTIPARSVKKVDCSKCKFRCPDHVTEKERENLFKNYWNLGSFKEKVEFISNCVQEFTPLRPISGKRAHSRRYKLVINGQEKRVCKEFFLSTFNISESTIVTYLNKKRKSPELIQDMRGKRAPSNKTPERVLREIREHILSQTGFRGIYDKLPNNAAPNIKVIYRLYTAECEQDNDKPVSLSMYRKVFGDLHGGKGGTPILIPPLDLWKDRLNKGCSHRQTEMTRQSAAQAGFLATTSNDNELSFTSHSSHSISQNQIHVLSNHETIHHQDGPPKALSSINLENHCTVPEEVVEGKSESLKKLNVLNLLQVSDLQYYISQGKEKLSYLQADSVPESQYLGSTQSCLKPIEEPQGVSLSDKFTNNKTNKPDDYALHKPNYCHTNASQSVSQSKNLCKKSQIDRNTLKIFQNGLESFEKCSENLEIIQRTFPNIQSVCSPLSYLNNEMCSQKSQVLTHKFQFHQKKGISLLNKRQVVANKTERSKKQPNSKTNCTAKKRERKEETWARNVRKRLRFKGEEYTSVRGKKVEAKNVQEIDCSKCRFKCSSKISEKKREEINSLYWHLDSLESRIAFITKGVQLYKPKRLMTGRRAFSRRYVFEVDKKEVQVCKDFFQTTLHISESTVATALEKSQKGPAAITDLRGKHEPANKTPEEIIQNICELVIFMTGFRPHRNNENHTSRQQIKTLYQTYKFDSESKGKKTASIGIFRSVLRKKFGIFGNPKCRK